MTRKVYLRSGGEDTDQIKRIKADLGFEDQYARNHLQINTGAASFIEMALKTRTFATDWSWSVLLQDFDNNGRKDIFTTNGIVKRPNDLDYINYLNSEAISKYAEDDPERTQKLIEQLPSQKLKNMLFLQSGNLNFSDIAEAQVGLPSFSNGAAFADLDGDGSLEIVVNNINEPATILKYNAPQTNNYLMVALNDPSGKTTLGTKLYAYTPNRTLYQELQVVKGYQSSSSHQIHFGFGEEKVDSLLIVWPDLSQQVIPNIETNSHLEITKPVGGSILALESIKKKSFNILPIPQLEK